MGPKCVWCALRKFYYIEKKGVFYTTCSTFCYILPQQLCIGKCVITKRNINNDAFKNTCLLTIFLKKQSELVKFCYHFFVKSQQTVGDSSSKNKRMIIDLFFFLKLLWFDKFSFNERIKIWRSRKKNVFDFFIFPRFKDASLLLVVVIVDIFTMLMLWSFGLCLIKCGTIPQGHYHIAL